MAWALTKTGRGVKLYRLIKFKFQNRKQQKQQLDNKPSQPHILAGEEEQVEETTEPSPIMPTLPPKPLLAPVSRATPYKCKHDEIKWDAVYKSSKYISKGFHRDEIIIDPPASFDGTDGTYQVAFENENQVLVFKIAPNPVLSDPHFINSFYAKYYGVMTADDSARHQAFKASAKRAADKWYTFRYHLDWPGKPSEDLGAIPWLVYAAIEAEGRQFPMIIFNISSIRPIEESSH